ncbi:MAG: CinA family protein [Haloarculaceae archaeon]
MRQFAADPPVEQRVAAALDRTDATVAVAESCTGGRIGSLLTDVPGASDFFDRGLVTYSEAAKRDELGVDRAVLAEHSATSAPVARQMALGCRRVADTTWGLSTTGLAGPAGDDSDTPVGVVFVGVAAETDADAARPGDDGGAAAAPRATVERYRFSGERRAVKEKMARQALWDLLGAIETRE